MSFLEPNKIFHHPEKLAQWYYTGDTTGPITVKIDLTNVCNHNCPGCIDADLIADDNNELKYDLVLSLLHDLKRMNVKGINYTGGGEPTAHKKFAEVIRATSELGFDIGLICNGSLFHKYPMEELLEKFTWIRISLDAFDEETHVRTHGSKATFKKTIKNIKELVKIKKEQNLETTIGVGYITNQHADMDRQVWRFIELCKEAGVDYAQLRPSFGFMFDYGTIKPKEWRQIFKELQKYETGDFKVVFDEGKYEKILSNSVKRSYSSCHAQAFKSTSITAVGGVYICCSLSGKPTGYIGNILEENFYDIWNGTRRQQTLAELDVKRCPALCVGDNLNEFLENFKKNKVEHKNFL